MLVCIYENRAAQIPGLKLLLTTLREYCPSWPIQLRFPHAPEELKTWIAAIPGVRFTDQPATLHGIGYNIKPSALLEGLESGAEQCLWLDTDILVNGDLRFLEDDPPEKLIVAEEPWVEPEGSTNRARAWGFTPARTLSGPLNSCVLRVSVSHRELLQAWVEALQQEEYLNEQHKPMGKRKSLMLNDQDALSALLASDRFADVPLRYVRHGRQIIQHHGAGAFGPVQRITVLRSGSPPLLHAMGDVKPWNMPREVSMVRNPREYYERLYLELSPYVSNARRYRSRLAEKDTQWLDVKTGAARVGRLLSANHMALRGGLQATAHRALWRANLIRLDLLRRVGMSKPA